MSTPESHPYDEAPPTRAALTADRLQSVISSYVEEYEFRGDDGDHTPTESERVLIEDAINGLLADDRWLAARATPGTGTSEPMFLVAWGGDGFGSMLVRKSGLEDAYLTSLFGAPEDAPADEREEILARLRDPMGWITDGGEPVRYQERFEDGWVEIIRVVNAENGVFTAKPEDWDRIDATTGTPKQVE